MVDDDDDDDDDDPSLAEAAKNRRTVAPPAMVLCDRTTRSRTSEVIMTLIGELLRPYYGSSPSLAISTSMAADEPCAAAVGHC